MSAANRVISFLFVVSLFSLMTGCVVSKNPACAEKDAKLDERLIGQWKGGGKDDKIWKVEKSKDVENALVVTVPDAKNPFNLLAFGTTIDSKLYLSLRGEKAAENEKDAGYLIFQYNFVDDDTVESCGMDSKAIAKAFEDKQLQGQMEKDKDGNESPKITDSTENIIRYLESHAADCFPEKAKQNFKRQK